MGVTVGWQSGAASDPGLRRSNNEDRVYLNNAAGIFLVVDGMGGRAAGELAAQTAIQIIVGHVGDTRLYLVWNGTLRKLTADHSPVGEMEDQGELTEAAAMEHPER